MTGVPNRTVYIVDPDVPAPAGQLAMPLGGTIWLYPVTNADGYYAIRYQGNDVNLWRSYAVDAATGKHSGILTFRPAGSTVYKDPNPAG